MKVWSQQTGQKKQHHGKTLSVWPVQPPMETEDGTITFADLGIKTSQTTKDTFLGKVRSVQSLNRQEIAFLVLSLLCILVAIALTIYRLVQVDKGTADFTFAIVLIINSCFCLYYVVSGVFFERPYELGVLALASGVVWLYVILNYAISEKGPYKMARLIASSVLTPCVMVLALWLAKSYHDSKNLIFRTVGANSDLQDLCQTMFVFYSLLKGDLQVCVTTAVLILTGGQHLNTLEAVMLPSVLVVGCLSIIAGFLSVRYEIKWMMIFYYSIWVTMPAYAIFLIIKSAQDLHSHADNTVYSEGIMAVTFVAAGTLLITRVVALFYSIKVYLNFGMGLKDRVYGDAMEIFSGSSVQQNA